ncbi:hypothetical protein N0V90_007697 [Kalmusia sp. IMI 367209]|nr:hypothetical protein N0V90_007697 [Kalmusia sp. IMI 367209]
MANYNKQTVANLRQLLKDRGIPSTGLTRKAQIVEKLEEWDSNNATEGEAETAQPEESGNAAAPTVIEAPPEQPRAEHKAPEPAPVAPDTTTTEQPAKTEETVTDSSAPQSAQETNTPEAQGGNIAIAAPKEAAEPTTGAVEPPHIPTESHATDFARVDRTPSPSPDEKPSIEKPELLPAPERSTPTTADPSRLNTEELEADTRKRKRRSQTPELSTQEIRAKKPRPSEDAVHMVAPAKDEDIVMDQRPPEPEEAEKALDEKAMDEEAVNGHHQIEPTKAEAEVEADLPPKDTAVQPTSQADPQPEKKDKAPRYRELFKPVEESSSTEAIADDRPIAPALHSATSAIYIRNFMRPLRPEALLLTSLFLDAMKTHALVHFTSTTAASRVRASLHGTPWPPEGNRKDLWVDFVPEDACSDWIAQEEDAIAAEKEARASGRPIASKKFEVVYPEDDEGGFTAVFQEVGASALAFNPPKGPRHASHQVPPTLGLPAAPTQETRLDIEKSFETLKNMFSVTTAKPALYFMPVSDEHADQRRKELDLETSRDWAPEEKRKGRGMQASRLDQKVRFSFDDGDRIIEAGGDFGPWTEREIIGLGAVGVSGEGGGGGGWRSGELGVDVGLRALRDAQV